jgi:hypothetical protein
MEPDVERKLNDHWRRWKAERASRPADPKPVPPSDDKEPNDEHRNEQ